VINPQTGVSLPVVPEVVPESEDLLIRGGNATRDEKLPGKPVISVSLYDTEITDAGSKELGSLKNLTSLNLVRAQVTGASLKELAELKNLTSLNLDLSTMTDTWAKELAALTSLTLGGRLVTDARGEGTGYAGRETVHLPAESETTKRAENPGSKETCDCAIVTINAHLSY